MEGELRAPRPGRARPAHRPAQPRLARVARRSRSSSRRTSRRRRCPRALRPRPLQARERHPRPRARRRGAEDVAYEIRKSLRELRARLPHRRARSSSCCCRAWTWAGLDAAERVAVECSWPARVEARPDAVVSGVAPASGWRSATTGCFRAHESCAARGQAEGSATDVGHAAGARCRRVAGVGSRHFYGACAPSRTPSSTRFIGLVAARAVTSGRDARRLRGARTKRPATAAELARRGSGSTARRRDAAHRPRRRSATSSRRRPYAASPW